MNDLRPEVEQRFIGILSLINPLGTLYTDYTQTGVLTITAGATNPGGYATIKIIANGDAINLPATWIKYAGDDISIDAADENHLQVYYKDADTIYYTNKVVTP
jgi:hypothetical protein